MTKGEAMVLETDAVIFPMDFGQEKQATGAARAVVVAPAVENETVEVPDAAPPSAGALDSRFARLRKSLRKRSAGIL